MPVYPDEILLPVGDELRNFLKEKSGVIQTLDEFDPTKPLPLRKDEIFVGYEPADQQHLWELFVDVFNLIPDYNTGRRVFLYTKNGTKIEISVLAASGIIFLNDFALFGQTPPSFRYFSRIGGKMIMRIIINV